MREALRQINAEKGEEVTQFIFLLMFFCTITGVSILTAYFPVYANIPFNIIGGILVLTFLKPVFFEKLKLSTLLVMRIAIALAVLGILPGSWYVNIVMVFLVINILEATLTDLKGKHYFNVISGIAVAIGTLGLVCRWQETGLYTADARTMIGTMAWIIAYTLWNWVFVTYEFSSGISLLHIAVLASPIFSIIILQNAGLWLLLRANSLTFTGILQIGDKKQFEKALENKMMTSIIESLHKDKVQVILMIINILLTIAVFKVR